jgi:hypothetical protein
VQIQVADILDFEILQRQVEFLFNIGDAGVILFRIHAISPGSIIRVIPASGIVHYGHAPADSLSC